MSAGAQPCPADIDRFFAAGIIDDENIAIGVSNPYLWFMMGKWFLFVQVVSVVRDHRS
jgi:hypothetical protein